MTSAQPSPAAVRLASVSRATLAIEGSASPRKPRVAIADRSPLPSFDVAWRSTARRSSAAVMPQPSSVTPMCSTPPASRSITIRAAPASIAFSTSSLTAEAGRSTTSPAAIWLTS